METKLKLKLTAGPDGPAFTDAQTGMAVDPAASLMKTYGLKAGHTVHVLIKADDLRHSRAPFSLELAAKVIDAETDGHFMTRTGDIPQVYAYRAAGTHPVLGLLPDGKVMQWNEKGQALDGTPDNDIIICVSNDQQQA
jgi:hypothetical protein